MLNPAVILFYLFLFVNPIDCDSIENYLGTKSAYRYVANLKYKNEDVDGCATKIWMFVRHGTRYPSTTVINLMHHNLTRLRDDILAANRLIKPDLLLFEKWYPRVEKHEAKLLAIEGEMEMLELAERMRARFPQLLKPVYSNTSYVFRYTTAQRTQQSSKYFVTGLFGRSVLGDVYYPAPVPKDPILRFYKLCNKWDSMIKRNSMTLAERDKFDSGSDAMKWTLHKISNRLGLKQLTLEELRSMYTTCAFEVAWSKLRKSPWCIPFDVDAVKVMEYSEDLKYYWVDGYGYNLTCHQACPLFRDMFKFITSKEKYPNASFYFSHSGALLKFLCHLGVHKDASPLLASNFKANKNRRWRVSKIDPFGNNLAFICFECGGTKSLLTLHNERVIRLPPCPHNDLCDINLVEKYYQDSLNCSFDKICENNVPPGT